MPASSNVRRIIRPKRQSGAGGGISGLPIPDPRTWPSKIRTWFHDAVGEWGPLDVFVFNYGSVAACYIHDAVTVGELFDVTGDEWHIEGGYPVFVFDPVRIGEIQDRLGSAGYDVHVLVPTGKQRPSARRLAPVVCITSRAKDRKAEKQNEE